ncbi:MAG: choline/ethanolamine kinase family protein [Gammaproteobacteria bacterium]
MLPGELQRLALRHVPGTGQPDIHRLRGGLVNETYRVLRDGVTYAVRVAAASPYDSGVDREWEARVLELAAAADLAPVVEYFDPMHGILITRWQAGRTWSPADAGRPANISRMAALARRIHALPVPPPPRLMSPAKWIDYYSWGAQGGAGAALRPAALLQLDLLALLPTVTPVLCHSDLHALNVIDRGDSLTVLDWEYAHASDPLWDLAGWSANNDLEDSLQHVLLRDYLGRAPTGNEYMRLRLLGWLYDYVCLLWSELYLNLTREGRADGAVGGRSDEQRSEAAQTEPGVVADRARLIAARLTHQSSRTT